MFHGTTVDELMQMVENAERHAVALAEDEHDLGMAVIAAEAMEREALAGVA